ncbi:unnamed protein product, partial [Polarella glacialis]
LAEKLCDEFLEGGRSGCQGLARCNGVAARWGFAPTDLGFRRLLCVVEEASSVVAGTLKAFLQDSGALPKDPACDGLFDWDDLGGND